MGALRRPRFETFSSSVRTNFKKKKKLHAFNKIGNEIDRVCVEDRTKGGEKDFTK